MKLRLVDFEWGSQVLETLNANALRQVDFTRYLVGFSDEKLFAIAMKPGEWSAIDRVHGRRTLVLAAVSLLG